MTDLSGLSDGELKALYGNATAASASDLSHMSDDELKAAHAKNQQTPMQALLGVNGPRYQLWPERMARGMIDAAALPGDVASGKQAIDYSDPQFMGRLTGLASLGSPMSVSARAGEGVLGVPMTKEASAPTQQALFEAADTGYDKAKNLGVVLPAESLSKLSQSIADKLFNEHGITPEQAPGTFSTLDRLKSPPEGATVTVPNLDALRQNFGRTAGNFNNPTDQFAAITAKRALADHLASLTDDDAISGPASQVAAITKEANGNYAAGSRAEQIAEALKNAEYQAGSTSSGRNLDNATRQKFRSILTSDKASAGYTPDELDQLETIVMGTPSADRKRMIGNYLGGGGGLGMLHSSTVGGGIGATVGGAVGGPVGAGIGATVGGVGTAALGSMLKRSADAATLREVENLSQMTRARSPLAESLPQTQSAPLTPKQAAFARVLLQLDQTPIKPQYQSGPDWT